MLPYWITPINEFIAVLLFLSAFAEYSQNVYIWQLKEYRRDKFRDFLSTKQGYIFFSRPEFLVRVLLVLFAFFLPINEIPLIKNILVSFLFVDLAYVLYRFTKQELRRPKITAKSTLLVGLSLATEAIIIFLIRDWAYIFILIAARFLITSFWVAILEIPTVTAKKWYIHRAKQKIAQYPNLTVIGITGSFGKTTVKTFLHHILSGKFHVIATPGNINTEIGIAQFILKTDFSEAKIFIVEMGAYKIGEIKLICDMVRPKIGILTAINEQHIALFGSIRNIQQAKYELLRSLPKDGLAIVNNDNSYCRELLSELTCQVATFGIEEEYKPTCLIQDVETTKTGIRCTGIYTETAGTIDVPVHGEHNALHIAACIIAVDFLGMSKDERRARIQTLSNPEQTLKVYTWGSATLIDDSRNANPDGFKAALAFIGSFSSEKRRIVVTRGMYELGAESDRLHEQIGGEISFVADELVVIEQDFFHSIQQGIVEKFKTNVQLITDRGVLRDYLYTRKKEPVVILLENRLPSEIYEQIMKEAVPV